MPDCSAVVPLAARGARAGEWGREWGGAQDAPVLQVPLPNARGQGDTAQRRGRKARTAAELRISAPQTAPTLTQQQRRQRQHEGGAGLDDGGVCGEQGGGAVAQQQQRQRRQGHHTHAHGGANLGCRRGG